MSIRTYTTVEINAAEPEELKHDLEVIERQIKKLLGYRSGIKSKLVWQSGIMSKFCKLE